MKALSPGQKPTITGANNSTQEIPGRHSCTWRWDRKASKGAKEGTAGTTEETQGCLRQCRSHGALGRLRSGLACGALSDLDRSVRGGGLQGSLGEAVSARAPESHYLGQWKGQRTREGGFGLFLF